MGPRRRIALVVVALTVALGAAVPAAYADQDGVPETAQLNMAADGTGSASTDTVPADATKADITVTPLTDEQFFSRLAISLGNPHYDFNERVEACVYLTQDVVKNPNTFPGYTIPKERTLQLLFLAACLQTALQVSLQGPPQARDAKAACFQTQQAIGLTVTRTGSGYSGRVSPTSKRPKKLLPRVRVTCKRTAKGLQIKVRPRKRGQKLRSTVGKTLQLGVANPSKAAIKLKISFLVNR